MRRSSSPATRFGADGGGLKNDEPMESKEQSMLQDKNDEDSVESEYSFCLLLSDSEDATVEINNKGTIPKASDAIAEVDQILSHFDESTATFSARVAGCYSAHFEKLKDEFTEASTDYEIDHYMKQAKLELDYACLPSIEQLTNHPDRMRRSSSTATRSGARDGGLENDDTMESDDQSVIHDKDDEYSVEYSVESDYSYGLSDSEDVAVEISNKASDTLAELDRILSHFDELTDAFSARVAGCYSAHFKKLRDAFDVATVSVDYRTDHHMKQLELELDYFCIPLIEQLTNFINEENDVSEDLVLVTMKMSPGFNGLLSLLQNDSLVEWGERKIYGAILDMLDLLCESNRCIAILLHNCVEGDSKSTCKTFLSTVISKVIFTRNTTAICKKILSTNEKINSAVENARKAGIIAPVGPSDDDALQFKRQTSDVGSERNDLVEIMTHVYAPPTAELTSINGYVDRKPAAQAPLVATGEAMATDDWIWV